MINQQFRDGITTIKLSEHYPLRDWMLNSPLRGFVITRIKDPIRNALETGKSLGEVIEIVKTSMSRLPRIGKGNLRHLTVLVTKEKTDKLLSYHHNPSRDKMIEAGIKLFLSEDEHDDYYAWLKDYLVIELALEVVRGNYLPRRLKFPVKACWSGPDLPDRKELRRLIMEALNADTSN